jgi:hypothetical protein
MWFLGLWNWFVGGIRKNLEKWARESLGCSKQSLMSNSGAGLADQSASRNVNSKGCAYMFSGGNKDSIGNWTRGHSCYIIAKNLSTFCLCPETLSEAEFKSNGLINLTEEISNQLWYG